MISFAADDRHRHAQAALARLDSVHPHRPQPVQLPRPLRALGGVDAIAKRTRHQRRPGRAAHDGLHDRRHQADPHRLDVVRIIHPRTVHQVADRINLQRRVFGKFHRRPVRFTARVVGFQPPVKNVLVE